MASTKAVYASLTMLSHNFAGAVTEEKVALWKAALLEVSDEALAAAVPQVIATHKGDFIPPVAVIRDAAGANTPPSVDVEEIQKQISDLGGYNPHMGWVYPRVSLVREKLGDAIADAYAACGAQKLFSDEEIGRSIATREFRKELEVQATGGRAGLLAAPQRAKLSAGATE